MPNDFLFIYTQYGTKFEATIDTSLIVPSDANNHMCIVTLTDSEDRIADPIAIILTI